MIGILLLHASIMEPLLVRCIPDEGHATLELIGQDPHKHEHSDISCSLIGNASQVPLSFYACDAQDCHDLLLDIQAVLWPASIYPSPLSDGIEADASVAVDDRSIRALKPLLDSFPESVLHPEQSLSLRI